MTWKQAWSGIFWGALPALLAWSTATQTSAPTPQTAFSQEVLPVLKASCFGCHGPEKQNGGLRLDSREAMLKGGDSGPAILPGKGKSSLLVKRINGSEPPRMPLRSASLSEKQIATIQSWIDQGAVWEESAPQHWAFVAPKRPALPKVKNSNWAQNEIDLFILSRLEREKLKPSPEADRSTLLRRVSLDLTGIPPTPAEMDAFLKDKSPDAYEKAIDRLLASPRYGERMAMDWLDYARYADSNGYQADFERYQWRWRDWVIQAFNNNMPYDQFTIEQIAGDMLPNATLEQRIATGFSRNHRINTEGGVIAEEWRVENVIDRVETTSTIWLGLTMGCARCHDHKYDPISQKEFYQFYAYFNNVPESGTGEERPVNHPPLLKAPTPQQAKQMTAYDKRIGELENQIQTRLTANEPRAMAWQMDDASDIEKSLTQDVVGRYALSLKPHLSGGDASPPVVSGEIKEEAGHSSGAVDTTRGHIDLGGAGDFEKHQSFSYGAWVNPANGNNGAPLARMDSRNDFRGWDLYLAGMRPMAHIIHRWPSNTLKVVSKKTVPVNQWSHILVTYDGSAKPEGLRIYINGQPVETTIEVNTLTETIRTEVSTKVGTRTGSDQFAGKVDDPVIYRRALSSEEVMALAGGDTARSLAAIPPAQRSPEQKLLLTRFWSKKYDSEYRRWSEELDQQKKARVALDSQITTVMVMEEMPQPRDCYVLIRGQYDQKGETVSAGLPAVLPPMPANSPNNRLGLAKWIMDPQNPLTARVTVNRLWERFFGAGIVRTSEDFGTRGELPSHPELLDWLATELVRLKWNLKAVQKTIVMSATYRQSSAATPELLRRDPQNRLLARGARFRLPAEVIRDQALAVSGLLVEKTGGPSVRPYQPEGIWNETNNYGNLLNYQHDKDANLYRRSLYTIWKRTAAPPTMTLFDAPGREMCRVSRARTNTPLQALALMNETTYVEASRVLAQRMMKYGGRTPEQRIRYAYRWVLGRAPTVAEMRVLLDGLQKRLARYQSDEEAALRLVSIGEYIRDEQLNVAELAAYTLTASVILNLDETITKE